MTFEGRVKLLKFFGFVTVFFAVMPLFQQWFGFGPLTTSEIFWNSVVVFGVGVIGLVFGVQHAMALSRAKR
jgi:hypothetical protein